MSHFIQGDNRNQAILLPDCLDDYIAEENAVRVIDVFVDELELSELGFKTIPSSLGRPAYHPATLLKLYIYGYLNRVQSSRRLEREAQRNVELMWLIGRLAPDFKTIADFRKDNGKSIQCVCREFVMLCRKLELFADALIAIDGSKFKAVNSQDRNFTKAKLERRLAQIDQSIQKYMEELTRADRQEAKRAKTKATRLQTKIADLKKEMSRLKELNNRLEKTADKQISLTDPDSRAMSAGGKSVVGYNVQTAVENTHHLIVAHDVINARSDRGQLFNMASQAKQALNVDELETVADRGYYSGPELLKCEQNKITSYVAKPQTHGRKIKGGFDRNDFIYDADKDEYICPAGERLPYRFTYEEHGKQLRRYWRTDCGQCSIKSKCTTGRHRRISRWEHEAVLEKIDQRVSKSPEHMKIRKQTVEHPFGTLKSWMGATHFQMRTLKNVRTEMSLHVLAYNLKRVMAIMGTTSLIRSIQA